MKESSWLWFAPVLMVVALFAGFSGCGLRGPGRAAESHVAPTITIGVQAPGLALEEMETLVAAPIESQIQSMPGVRRVVSVSRLGTCSIWLELDSGTELFEARQRVAERLQLAQAILPADATAMLVPAAAPESDVLLIAVHPTAESAAPDTGITSGMELRMLAEYVVRPRLLAVPGVTEIIVTGGTGKQYQVVIDNQRLLAFGVTLPQLEEALRRNFLPIPAGSLKTGDQGVPLEVRPNASSLQDLEDIVVVSREGVPVRVKDLASVQLGGPNRLEDGAIWNREPVAAYHGPAVILTVFHNADRQSGEFDRPLTELERSLPAEMQLARHTFTADDVSVALQLPAGTSQEERGRVVRQLEKWLAEVPEIRSVWRRGGSDGAAEEQNVAVLFVALERSARRPRAAILADIRERIARTPGVCAQLGPPMSQLPDCEGIDAQITVKVFGSDLDVLQNTARAIQAGMSKVPGVVDLLVEPLGEHGQVQVRVDRERAAHFGVTPADVALVLETAQRGRKVGQVRESGRVHDIVMTYDESLRRDPGAISELRIATPTGQMIPLGSVADLLMMAGPIAVYRENLQRRIIVSCNVQGRERKDVLADVRKVVEDSRTGLPAGYSIEVGGGESDAGP